MGGDEMVDEQEIIKKQLIRNLVIVTVAVVGAFCLARIFSIIFGR